MRSVTGLSGKTHLEILNLGAGVQSTTLYLLACGDNPKFHYDAAIFGDTKGEPKSVYRHLQWLKTQPGPPIFVHSVGSLKSDLINGRNSTGQRFLSIPAFVAPLPEDRPPGWNARKDAGRSKRQCTREYKIDVVEWVIRRRLLALKYRQRMPKGIRVNQSFGITTDEAGRAKRIAENFAKSKQHWTLCQFPLIGMNWSRNDCKRFLQDRVPHPVPKSACTFCPYHDDVSWRDMKENDPESFADAVAVDRAIRTDGAKCAERMGGNALYLHRQCIPLEMVDLSKPEPPTLDLFSVYECEGFCGN